MFLKLILSMFRLGKKPVLSEAERIELPNKRAVVGYALEEDWSVIDEVVARYPGVRYYDESDVDDTRDHDSFGKKTGFMFFDILLSGENDVNVRNCRLELANFFDMRKTERIVYQFNKSVELATRTEKILHG
jgi:hypothetical protein